MTEKSSGIGVPLTQTSHVQGGRRILYGTLAPASIKDAFLVITGGIDSDQSTITNSTVVARYILSPYGQVHYSNIITGELSTADLKDSCVYATSIMTNFLEGGTLATQCLQAINAFDRTNIVPTSSDPLLIQFGIASPKSGSSEPYILELKNYKRPKYALHIIQVGLAPQGIRVKSESPLFRREFAVLMLIPPHVPYEELTTTVKIIKDLANNSSHSFSFHEPSNHKPTEDTHYGDIYYTYVLSEVTRLSDGSLKFVFKNYEGLEVICHADSLSQYGILENPKNILFFNPSPL